MTFIIDDTGLPCTAAGLGGVFVPEELTILEVCQDPNDLTIVYIIATIRGVYAYTPTLNVSWGGTSIVVDSTYIPSYKGEGVTSFPIDNKCETNTVTLAYNIGSVIPDFKTTESITLDLTFNGSSEFIDENSIIASTFQSSNPSSSHLFIKGLTPKPYKVYFDSISGKLKVQFLGMGDKPCICSIDCAVPTEDDFNISICKDEIQEVSISKSSIVGDPAEATITFVDSVGNESAIGLQLVNEVIPLGVQVFKDVDNLFARVNFHYTTINGKKLDGNKLMYQIVRYEGSQNNAKIWKDWSAQPTNGFIDSKLKAGKTYGYSVRFKGEFDEISNSSPWTEVVI